MSSRITSCMADDATIVGDDGVRPKIDEIGNRAGDEFARVQPGALIAGE
ncbi:MAG: hypothetical protein AB7Q16_24220 [Vicinamibacterales bacterium]